MKWIATLLGYLNVARFYRARKAARLGNKLLAGLCLTTEDGLWLAQTGIKYHEDPKLLLTYWARAGEAQCLREAFQQISLRQIDRAQYAETCSFAGRKRYGSRYEGLELLYEVYGRDIPYCFIAAVASDTPDIRFGGTERSIWLEQRKEIQVKAAEELVRQNRIVFLESIYGLHANGREILQPLAEEWLARHWEQNCRDWKSKCDLLVQMCVLTNDVCRAKELFSLVEDENSFAQQRRELVDFLYRSGSLVFVSPEGAPSVPHSAEEAPSCT